MAQDELDFSNATVDTGHPLNKPDQPASAQLMDAFKTGVAHGVRTAASGLNPLNIPEALWETGKNVYGAAKEGDIAGAIDAAALNPVSAQKRANARAQEAYSKGNHAEGALHDLFSVLPIIGPTGEEAYNNLLEGIRTKDPGKIGDAVGGVAALLAPEALPLSRHLPENTPIIGSEPLMKSAGESYYKTLTPLDVPNKVPAAQRAARDLAEGPAPVAMTRQAFIDKMSAGANASADQAKAAINFDTTGKTGPVRPLLDALDEYARENYTSPHAAGGGQRVPINLSGLAAIQDLKDRIVGASAGNSPAVPGGPGTAIRPYGAGLVRPGEAPGRYTNPPPVGGRPAQPVTDVALEHTEKLRQGLEKGTLNSKGDWRTDISPDSVQAMDRAHAAVIRRWQEEHAPEIQEGRDPVRMFSQMRDRAQEVKNRLDAGGPRNIPIWANVKSGKMPQAIQNSMANIPWNTVSGSTKAALSKSIASGDWGRTARILQFAKLGVPVGDNSGQ